MILRALKFSITLQSDGATNSVELDIPSSPWFFFADPPGTLSSSFDLTKTLPTSVVDVTSSTVGVPTISSATITGNGKKLTVTFDANVPAGVFNLNGTFIL